MYTLIDHSKYGIYYLRRTPFLLYGRQYNTTYSTYINGNRTNRIRPGRSVISLSFPTLPEQPGLTVRYSALLYTLIHLLLEIGNRGPGLGPQDKAPRFISHVPLFFWGGNHAASRRTAGVYTHTGHLNGSKGRHTRQFYGNLQLRGSMVRMADRAR